MDDIMRNFGEQPIAGIMAGHELKPSDLVAASTDHLTFKMVSRACKGRRLTPHVQAKVRDAVCKATGETFSLKDLFNY